MIQMDREVRAREGDMELRTNPHAPCITNQPSQVQPMRYVSPRQTTSENSQNRDPNIRGDCNRGACDGTDPLSGLPVLKKLQKPPKSEKHKADKYKSDKSNSEKPKFEEQKLEKLNSKNCNKSPQPKLAHLEMSQLRAHGLEPLKAKDSNASGANSSSPSRDASSPRSNKEAQDEKKSLAKADLPLKASRNERKKDVRSSSSSSSAHDLADCPPEVPPKEADSKKGADSSTDTKAQSQQHVLASCSSIKVDESETSTHSLVECTKVKVATEKGKTSEHTITDNETIIVGSSKGKGKVAKKDAINTTDIHELSYVHDFTDCPVDKEVLEYYEKEEKRSQASQQHAFIDCSRTSPTSVHYSNSPEQHALVDCPEKDASKKARSVSSQPHALADCPEKDTSSKTKSSGPQAHALVDCDDTENSSEVKSARLRPHDLVDCTREDVSNSTGSEQHALADCRGDAGGQSRRASSPDSHTDKHPQTKQHRLASCPVPTLNQKDEEEVISNHLAENTRINQSGDSQSTVKPSSHHTLSDCMGGTNLERQVAVVDRQTRTERRSSLSSLRDLVKGDQDIANHPRKSRYRKEVDNAANASWMKRPSQAQNSAQHALSQVLAGSGHKKENSYREPVEAIRGGVHSVGDEVKKQTDKMGDAIKSQTDKVGDEVEKQKNTIKEEIKKQTEKIGGKEEHKGTGGGFSTMFSKITSPKTKAHQ